MKIQHHKDCSLLKVSIFVVVKKVAFSDRLILFQLPCFWKKLFTIFNEWQKHNSDCKNTIIILTEKRRLPLWAWNCLEWTALWHLIQDSRPKFCYIWNETGLDRWWQWIKLLCGFVLPFKVLSSLIPRDSLDKNYFIGLTLLMLQNNSPTQTKRIVPYGYWNTLTP